MIPSVMGFRFLDHTADVRFEVWAEDLRGLFVEAARALFSIIVDLQTVRPEQERQIEVQEEGRDLLLVGWLNELLFLHDTEGFLFSEFEAMEVGPSRFVGRARGEVFDPERHEILLPVKAVTYHGLKVERTAGGFRAEIILDV